MSPHLEQTTPKPRPLAAQHRALVLVIDPNETTRSVLEVALNRDGFDVWSSSTGHKALELLRLGRVPDVVVLEAELGADDAFSLVASLRGDAHTAHVPVLLLASAHSRPNLQALAEVVGIEQSILKPAFARDVVALVRLECARREGRGELRFLAKTLPPAQLLRALLSCPRSGRLLLANGRGEVTFRSGRLISVRFDGRHDLDALVRALALTKESYRLSLEQVDGAAQLHLGSKEFVMQVLPRLARWDAVHSRSLPLDSKLVVDFGRLALALKTMPEGINQVTQLFDGFRTLQEVLIDSPHNETVTLEVATRLHLMGVLTPAAGEALASAGKLAPRLFEPAAHPDVLMHELFADAGAPVVDAATPTADAPDWFAEFEGEGLELNDPDGGWTALSAPEILSGLPDSMQQQLSAFNIQMEIEPPAPASAAALASFPEQFEEETTPPLGVSLSALLAAPAPAPAPATVKAKIAQPLAPLEAEFFGDSTRELPAQAAAPAHPAIISKKRRSSSLASWVGFGVAVVALAALIEALRAEKVAPVVLQAPVAATVVAPAVALAPAPAPADEPSAPEAIDISDNLVEARRFYEAGQYSKALSVLDQVLSDAPRSADAWLLSALVHYDASDVAGAKNAIGRVLELDPKNARVQLLIATIAFDDGDRERAHQALNRYLELEPNGQHAKEAQALLKR